MRCVSCGAGLVNSFALVAYIPDPLGGFLDDLRRELVPGCNPHAHISILPPRPIAAHAEAAWEHIRSRVEEIPAFPITLTGVEIFPVTSVIYIAVGAGRRDLDKLHSALNTDVLEIEEPYAYHPHVTLGQDLAPERVEPVLEEAKRRWAESPYRREVWIDTVTFVQNSCSDGWLDLAQCSLAGTPSLP